VVRNWCNIPVFKLRSHRQQSWEVQEYHAVLPWIIRRSPSELHPTHAVREGNFTCLASQHPGRRPGKIRQAGVQGLEALAAVAGRADRRRSRS